MIVVILSGCDRSNEEELNKLPSEHFKINKEGKTYEFNVKQYKVTSFKHLVKSKLTTINNKQQNEATSDLKGLDKKKIPHIDGDFNSISVGFFGYFKQTDNPVVDLFYNFNKNELSEELKKLLSKSKVGQCISLPSHLDPMPINLPLSKRYDKSNWKYSLNFEITGFFVNTLEFKSDNQYTRYMSTGIATKCKSISRRTIPFLDL